MLPSKSVRNRSRSSFSLVSCLGMSFDQVENLSNRLTCLVFKDTELLLDSVAVNVQKVFDIFIKVLYCVNLPHSASSEFAGFDTVTVNRLLSSGRGVGTSVRGPDS